MTDTQDYKSMDAGAFLQALGTDGTKWTEAFRQIHPDCAVDDEVMLAWFCNAIMAGNDAAHGNPPLCGDHAAWLIEQEASHD